MIFKILKNLINKRLFVKYNTDFVKTKKKLRFKNENYKCFTLSLKRKKNYKK